MRSSSVFKNSAFCFLTLTVIIKKLTPSEIKNAIKNFINALTLRGVNKITKIKNEIAEIKNASVKTGKENFFTITIISL